MTGAQQAVLANVAGRDMTGAQVAIINVAEQGDMTGIQVGAVNYAAGKMEATFGIVNLSDRCNFSIATPIWGGWCLFGRMENNETE